MYFIPELVLGKIKSLLDTSDPNAAAALSVMCLSSQNSTESEVSTSSSCSCWPAENSDPHTSATQELEHKSIPEHSLPLLCMKGCGLNYLLIKGNKFTQPQY